MSARFVVLGLARARSPWFRSVGQWANAGSLPVEFVKCVSPVELRAHLTSGRALSAALLDGALPATDRDLIDTARDSGCAVIVVDDGRVQRDWVRLGASVVLEPAFDRQDLLDALSAHAQPIRRGAVVTASSPVSSSPDQATVAMVCGAGGTGSSTVAIALAQGLASDPDHRPVLLADFARRADLAMLHDVRDVIPGVQEVVDAHRGATPMPRDMTPFVFAIQERGYDLLLGLRRSEAWATLRPRAFAAAFDTICRSWRTVVCDTDADLEGEDDGGSMDVEERNVMARTVAAGAAVAFVVGVPGLKGVHSLVRTIDEVLDHGFPANRIIPVINRAPKNPRARAQQAAAVAQLLAGRRSAIHPANPLFLPERHVDDAYRDGVRLPAALTAPLVTAFGAVINRVGRQRDGLEPQRVTPGSLGHWSSGISAEPA